MPHLPSCPRAAQLHPRMCVASPPTSPEPSHPHPPPTPVHPHPHASRPHQVADPFLECALVWAHYSSHVHAPRLPSHHTPPTCLLARPPQHCHPERCRGDSDRNPRHRQGPRFNELADQGVLDAARERHCRPRFRARSRPVAVQRRPRCVLNMPSWWVGECLNMWVGG